MELIGYMIAQVDMDRAWGGTNDGWVPAWSDEVKIYDKRAAQYQVRAVIKDYADFIEVWRDEDGKEWWH